MSVLKIENVSYSYKNSEQSALKNISCSFEKGTFNTLMGSSGSGKTTLLSLMAGMDEPTSGNIYINGEDLATMDKDKYRREDIAMIFQAFQLFPLLTVLENVCYPMELNGMPKKEAEIQSRKLLESLGIDKDKHKRYPGNVSGGEQQRVAIARALSTGAKVLLADEPTGNLDTTNGQRIVEILRKLAHEEGYCVVVVTHNPDIGQYGDSLYQMRDGVLTLGELT